jgi:hypothetical protein
MGKKYQSEAMAAVHETMEALHNVGAIDKRTMRRFDAACLTPVRQALTPREERAGRGGMRHAFSGPSRCYARRDYCLLHRPTLLRAGQKFRECSPRKLARRGESRGCIQKNDTAPRLRKGRHQTASRTEDRTETTKRATTS